MRRRHAAHFLRSPRTGAPAFLAARAASGPGPSGAGARQPAERPRLVWRSEGDVIAELRLVSALHLFWYHGGHLSEGRSWVSDALQRSRTEGRTQLRGRALYADGILAWLQGATRPRGTGSGRACPSIARSAIPTTWPGRSGSSPWRSGTATPPARRAAAEESIAIYRQGSHLSELAITLNSLGTVALAARDNATVRSCYEEAAALSRELQDDWALSAALRGLGRLACRERDFPAAVAHLQESLAVLRQHPDRFFVSRGLQTLAEALTAQGEPARAARLFGAAESLRETIGLSIYPFFREEYDQAVLALRSALGEEGLASLWAEGRGLSLEQAVAHALSDPALADEQ